MQLVAQQTPCAQKPDAQSAPAAQSAPSGANPQLPAAQQIVPWQVVPDAQSALVAQVVLQLPSAPHAYGPQLWGALGTQSPTPSHRAAAVSVCPVQWPPPQTAPLAYRRQAPAPSQSPSVPQVAAPLSAQWPSGSCPAGT